MEGFTAEKLQEYREVFELFDENGDNKISSNELGTVMLSLGCNLSQNEILDIMKDVDANKNGFIEFDEFVKMMMAKESQGYSEDEIKAAFRMFDSDGNGYVDKKEFRHAMSVFGEPLSEKEIVEMMKAADTNKDGRIQYEEFVALLFSMGNVKME